MYYAHRQWNNVPLRCDPTFPTYFHTLSHDLRTPLGQISGFAELLNFEAGEDGLKREYVSAILVACDELTKTVLAHLQLVEGALPDQVPGASVGGTAIVRDDLNDH